MERVIPWIGHKNAFEYHLRCLGDRGHNVKGFYNTKPGLDYLERNEAPLVLMSFWQNNICGIGYERKGSLDIDIPYEASIFTLKKIREMDKHKETPIIVAGAVHNTRWNRLYLEAGASDIIDLSSCRLGEFREVVEKNLGTCVDN